HDRSDAVRQTGETNLGDLLRRDRAVLGIDEQPIVARRLGKQGHRGTAQMMDAEAEGEPAAADLLECVACQYSHVAPVLNGVARYPGASRPRGGAHAAALASRALRKRIIVNSPSGRSPRFSTSCRSSQTRTRSISNTGRQPSMSANG